MYDVEQIAAYYPALFAARQDVYSVWTPDGWRPQRSPFTPRLVIGALSGKTPPLSGYMIAPGSVSHVAAVDFDGDDGRALALATARAMAKDGLFGYVESSRRGAHLWCVLDDIQPAIAIRAALHGLLQTAGVPDTDPHVELRPGSDHIGDAGLGHCLRLPLMPHQRTGVAGVMLDSNEHRIGRSVAEVILAFEHTPAQRFLAWGERWRRPPITHIPKELQNPHEPWPEDTATASELLRDLWGVANARPGVSVRCPAHDDRVASLSILADDRRVICKANYCLLNNEDRGRGTHELRRDAPHAYRG